MLLFLSVGQIILLGAHDVTNCQESKGCMEVQISEVWDHEIAIIGGAFHNDIAVVKYLSRIFYVLYTYYFYCVHIFFYAYLYLCLFLLSPNNDSEVSIQDHYFATIPCK